MFFITLSRTSINEKEIDERLHQGKGERGSDGGWRLPASEPYSVLPDPKRGSSVGSVVGTYAILRCESKVIF